MQKGPLKFWRSKKETLKKYHANFTPENLVYMIFCGVGTYFLGGKGEGANNFFTFQKRGG